MPGIHVHKLSQLDWFDQEKGSLLTVPGSYWLFYKKNIYKFIFKYHRTTKNTTQFSYGKELLKIIRRIIKCHPSQGQQFGTQHLLVTYNCTSWTRQDKMFAILKFQQRTNAAAFSHAFVLTIKICSSSKEESLFNLKYPIVKEVNAGAALKNSTDTVDIDEQATVIHTIPEMPSRKLRACSGKRISQILKLSERALSQTSETSVSSTCQNDIVEKSANLHERQTELSTNCDNTKSEENTEQNPVAHRQNQSRRKDEIQKVEEAGNANEEAKRTEIQEQHKKEPKIQKYQIFSSSKPSSTDRIRDNVNERLLLEKSSSDENSVPGEHVADDKTKENSSIDNDVGENSVGSNGKSNRYFIKKDLDKTKQNQANARSATTSPDVDKLIQENSQQGTFEVNNPNEKVNEESTQKERCNGTVEKSSDKRLMPISSRTVDNRAQSSTYSKSYKARKQRNRELSERKTVVDDKVMRSSNITDLVMEGLMFTIRQDQDSVAVIEQKTKLEVDEVLENSEKVETEAGEKCLVNSSLLRLENLITMIDPPRDKDEQHKANHSLIANSAYSSSLNVSNTACYLNDINYVDRSTNRLDIPSYERRSLMEQSSPRGFGWQQQRAYPTIANNDIYSENKNAIERMDELMDWEVDDHMSDDQYMHKNDIGIINVEKKEDLEEVEDEEEDIVPEVFHSTVFLPKKTNASPPDTELLMDDIDVEETGKLETSMKDRNSTPTFCHFLPSNKMPTSETLTISKKSKSAKQETNIPRVISNKAITVEQMSPALQKILRRKCKFPPVKIASKTAHDNKEKTQSKLSTENAVTEMNAPLNQTNPHATRCQQQPTHSDVANSDSHSPDRKPIEKSEQSTESTEDNDHKRDEENCEVDSDAMNKSGIEIEDDAKETKNEEKDESRVTADLKDVTNSNSNAKLKEEEKNKEIHRTSQTTPSTDTWTRYSSLRKLQDITEDFYHDLHAYKKNNNATQQRRLRQRRKSLNSPEDIKNGKMRIEMLKFIQDMTEGVRVVVKRLDLNNRPSLS